MYIYSFSRCAQHMNYMYILVPRVKYTLNLQGESQANCLL